MPGMVLPSEFCKFFFSSKVKITFTFVPEEQWEKTELILPMTNKGHKLLTNKRTKQKTNEVGLGQRCLHSYLMCFSIFDNNVQSALTQEIKKPIKNQNHPSELNCFCVVRYKDEIFTDLWKVDIDYKYCTAGENNSARTILNYRFWLCGFLLKCWTLLQMCC